MASAEPEHAGGEALVGVDCGATSVRAQRFSVRGGARLEAAPEHAGVEHAGAAARRVAELEAQGAGADEAERVRAATLVDRTADVIEEVARRSRVRRLRLGICAPGRKTADGRGIAAARHGPRVPDFAGRLEEELRARDLELVAPLDRIHSDGDAAGWGEEIGVGGRFQGVFSALWIGAGTGLAEALKLDGRCVAVEAWRARLPPPWELRARDGGSFEDRLSMRAINAEMARRRGAAASEPDSLPEHLACDGDEEAREVLADAARHLADFVLHRILALWKGTPRHALQRVVLGAHTGRLLATRELAGVRATLENRLALGLATFDDAAMLAQYLDGDVLKRGLIVESRLGTPTGPAATGVAADALGLLADRRVRT